MLDKWVCCRLSTAIAISKVCGEEEEGKVGWKEGGGGIVPLVTVVLMVVEERQVNKELWGKS